MFRILMLTHHYFPHVGGNEGQCRLLGEELLKRGNRVIVVTKRYLPDLPKSERINNIPVFRVFCLRSLFAGETDNNNHGSKHGFFLIRLAGRAFARMFFYADELTFILAAVIKIYKLREKIDLIHVHQAHWIAWCGVIASKYAKRPVLLKDATLNGFSELKLMPFSGIMKRSIIKSGWFAAVSSDIYKNLQLAGVKRERIFKVPNGVAVPFQLNQLKEDNNEILFVGNFNQGKIKGLDILLQAFAIIRKKIPEARLIILGKGNIHYIRQCMSSFSVPDSQVRLFFNQRSSEYYRRCSVFVLPSRSEGMSNSLLEAMSHGMACVSTKVSGSVDMIINGFNGILIDIENAEQMANAIILLLSDKEFSKDLGINARKTVIRHYGIEQVTSMYQEIYRSITKTVTIEND